MTWTREEHISDVYTCIRRGVGPGSAFRGLSHPSPLGSRFRCHRLGEEGGGAGSRLGLPGVSLGRLHNAHAASQTSETFEGEFHIIFNYGCSQIFYIVIP